MYIVITGKKTQISDWNIYFCLLSKDQMSLGYNRNDNVIIIWP